MTTISPQSAATKVAKMLVLLSVMLYDMDCKKKGAPIDSVLGAHSGPGATTYVEFVGALFSDARMYAGAKRIAQFLHGVALNIDALQYLYSALGKLVSELAGYGSKEISEFEAYMAQQ
jgi:hypothetical protein